MKAKLTLKFEDGSSKQITINNVIELDVPDHGRNEISFRSTAKGWVMAVSKTLLQGKLADEFLNVVKTG